VKTRPHLIETIPSNRRLFRGSVVAKPLPEHAGDKPTRVGPLVDEYPVIEEATQDV
jgi:hypothetical protein